jgi:hypothetical protein
MAQTKTKAKSKSKSKTKPKAKAKPKTKAKAAKAKPKAKARKSASKAKATVKAKASGPNGSALDKLKGPATATGAALIAVAGGLAATRARNGHGRRRKVVKGLKRIDLPSADTAIDWVEKRATDVGDAADKAQQMTSTARKVKKALS